MALPETQLLLLSQVETDRSVVGFIRRRDLLELGSLSQASSPTLGPRGGTSDAMRTGRVCVDAWCSLYRQLSSLKPIQDASSCTTT